jgi:hypothetical protein
MLVSRRSTKTTHDGSNRATGRGVVALTFALALSGGAVPMQGCEPSNVPPGNACTANDECAPGEVCCEDGFCGADAYACGNRNGSGASGQGGSGQGGSGQGGSGQGAGPTVQNIVVGNASEQSDELRLSTLDPANGSLTPAPTASVPVDRPQNVTVHSASGVIYLPTLTGLVAIRILANGSAEQLPAATLTSNPGDAEVLASDPPHLAVAVGDGVRNLDLDETMVPVGEGPTLPAPPNSTYRDMAATPLGDCLYAVHADSTGFCLGPGSCGRVQVLAHDAASGDLSEVGTPVELVGYPSRGVASSNGSCLFVGEGAVVEAFAIGAGCSLSKVDELPTADSSFAVAVAPSNGFLYAIQSNANTVTAAAIGADCSLTEVEGSPFDTGERPFGVAVDPNSAHLVVSNFDGDNLSVFTIDASGALTEVTGSPFPGGVGPFGVFTFGLDHLSE